MNKRLLAVVLFGIVGLMATSCAEPASVTPTPTGKAAVTTSPAATPTSTTATAPAAAPAVTAAPKATAPSTTERKPTGTLTVLLSGLGSERWMPQFGPPADNSIMQGVYETLLYTMPGSNDPVPGLAERWEVSPDRTTWTYYLRKGVQFHDGYGELTADDAKFSYDLVVKQGSLNTEAVKMPAYVQSVEVVNPYQIVFRTKPIYDLNTQMKTNPVVWQIVSKKYVESAGIDKAAANPIGTGPFKFVEHRKGDYLKLEALDTHWRQVPYYKTLVIRAVPDQATAIASLRAGQADIARVDPASSREVKAAGVNLLSIPDDASVNLFFGAMYAPTSNGYDASLPYALGQGEKGLKVRKAITLAINKQEIIDNMYFGQGKLMSAMWSDSGHPETDPAWKPYPYDPDQAKKLLAEAGYPNGLDLKAISASMPGRPLNTKVTEALGLYLSKVGIRLQMEPLDFPTLAARARARKGDDALLVSTMARSSDTLLYWPSMKSNAGMTFWEVGNDALIDRALGAIDPAQRTKASRELGQYVIDNYMAVPLLSENSVYAVSNKVGRWPLPPGTYPMYYEYLTP